MAAAKFVPCVMVVATRSTFSGLKSAPKKQRRKKIKQRSDVIDYPAACSIRQIDV